MRRAWLVVTTLSGLIAGCPGPETDECRACDQIFCDGNTVATCNCYDNYPNGGFGYELVVLDDCAATATMCTELEQGRGRDRFDESFVAGDARCLDLCQTPGAAECREGTGEPAWAACAAPATAVAARPARGGASVLGSAPAEPAAGTVYAWLDAQLPCVECGGTCGCELESTCQDGYCLPGDAEQGLVCCGRERGTTCPDGATCEELDGGDAVCDTAGRCQACETTANCESLECVSTGAGPRVCLAAAEADDRTNACRDGENAVWSQDACGAWVALVDDCGDGFRCEGAECVENLPEIEVSPTLLTFDDTAVGQSSTETLAIGNIGFAPLAVSEIAVHPDFADIFAVAPASTTVAIDDIVEVEVTFSPDAPGEVSARLYVRSDDADDAEIQVLMNGTGIDPP